MPSGVTVTVNGREEHIAAHTVLWAAGVRASRLGKVLAERAGAPLDRAGRVMVEPDLSVPGHPEIFVIGDLATFTASGRQAAARRGAGGHAAGPLRGAADSPAARPAARRPRRSTTSTRATWRQSAATRRWPISARCTSPGFPAWFTWVFVHLMYLVEFDNRLLVFVEWVYNYFTRNRGARLITGGKP